MAPLTTSLGPQTRTRRFGGLTLRAPWRGLRRPELTINPRIAEHERVELARFTGVYRDACADPNASMSDVCRTARYSF